MGTWDLVTNLNDTLVVERDPNVQGFINIAEGDRLALDIKAVKFDLDSRLTPRLSLDGEEISSERIGFKLANEKTGKTLYTYVGVDFGEPGFHTLT